MTQDPYTQPPTGTAMEVPDNTLAVLGYRMTQLEASVKDVGVKLDHHTSLYVTQPTLELMLAPIRADIIEMQGRDREREKERNSFRSQLSLAIMVCIASPVASIIISVILGNQDGR